MLSNAQGKDETLRQIGKGGNKVTTKMSRELGKQGDNKNVEKLLLELCRP